MELYLIRHAQSINQTIQDQDERVFDPGLTQLGQRQASLLGEFLSSRSERVRSSERAIDAVFSSPMWRALQTTKPLSDTLDMRPAVWVDVHEQVYTTEVFPGSTRAEIEAAFPHYHLPEEITEEGWWNQAGESQAACMKRAIGVAEALCERADADESVAIVSHARFLDSLLKTFLHQLPGYQRWYHHFNTGVSRLYLGGDRLDIRYLNRVDHLPLEMVT